VTKAARTRAKTCPALLSGKVRTKYAIPTKSRGAQPLRVWTPPLVFGTGEVWNERARCDCEFDAKLVGTLGILEAGKRRPLMARRE